MRLELLLLCSWSRYEPQTCNSLHFCHFSLRLRPVCSGTKQIFNLCSPCLEPRSLSSPSGGPDVKLTPNQKGATRPLNIVNQNSEEKPNLSKKRIKKREQRWHGAARSQGLLLNITLEYKGSVVVHLSRKMYIYLEEVQPRGFKQAPLLFRTPLIRRHFGR